VLDYFSTTDTFDEIRTRSLCQARAWRKPAAVVRGTGSKEGFWHFDRRHIFQKSSAVGGTPFCLLTFRGFNV
jgi:hypothetical protein